MIKHVCSRGSVEDGIVELDDILRDRTATLKSERERAKAALDRARAQCGTAIAIDPEKIDAFSQLMIDMLDNGDVNARKGDIEAGIDHNGRALEAVQP
jgi:site-specific DNA recombinase